MIDSSRPVNDAMDEAAGLGPLDGVRVLECGQALAGPFACTLLGDFGADVIKIERINRGDSQRHMGPKVDGAAVWWAVTGRNKRSIAIDLQTADGRDLMLKLVAQADVLVENFRPGVLARLGLGYAECLAVNAGIVVAHVSGYGQTGPYSDRRGFGKIAEAFSGATRLTGDEKTPPTHPGYSLGDLATGLMTAFGVLLALFERDRSGTGQEIDLALYEPLFRMIEWQVPFLQRAGLDITRHGASFPFDAGYLTEICTDARGETIVVSAATGAMIARLTNLLVAEGAVSRRDCGSDEVREGLRQWLRGQSAHDAQTKLVGAGLVAGVVYGPRDLLEDPHVAARGNIVSVPHPTLGEVAMPGVIPALIRTPGSIRRSAPEHAADTREVLAEIVGLDQSRIDDLVNRRVIECR